MDGSPKWMVRDGESYIENGIFLGVPPTLWQTPYVGSCFNGSQESLNDTNAYYRRICHVFLRRVGGRCWCERHVVKWWCKGKIGWKSWDFMGFHWKIMNREVVGGVKWFWQSLKPPTRQIWLISEVGVKTCEVRYTWGGWRSMTVASSIFLVWTAGHRYDVGILLGGSWFWVNPGFAEPPRLLIIKRVPCKQIESLWWPQGDLFVEKANRFSLYETNVKPMWVWVKLSQTC